MVSPFEKRRLSLKGQKFLRVVDPKARFYHLKWQRPKVGDPSNRLQSRLRRDDRQGEPPGFRGGKNPVLSSKRHTMATVSQHRAAGGRWVAAGRWYAKKPTTAPSPPLGSRGRGPWSGRGSQRVKPRLVSPFERRRLFFKGQGFLRVVCPKAGSLPARRQRFRVGDSSARFTRSG